MQIPPVRYPHSRCPFTYAIRKRTDHPHCLQLNVVIGTNHRSALEGCAPSLAVQYIYTQNCKKPDCGQAEVGSLTGAVHVPNNNVHDLRLTQWGQKPHVELNGKCQSEVQFQCDCTGGNPGLSILLFEKELACL